MKILIAQINPTIGDFEGNTAKILNAIEEGKKNEADLVLFSELTLTGYPAEDFLLLPHFMKAVETHLETIIEASKGIAVIVGLPRESSEGSEKFLFNSAAVIQNAVLQGYYDKRLLPTYDVFDERRFFEPGSSSKLWDLNGVRIGLTICEDIWEHSDLITSTSYRFDPVKELAIQHPDLVLNLSASPYSVDQTFRRIKACQKASLTMQCPLLLCNQVGGNDSLIFDGYSCYMGLKGELLAHAKGFQEDFLLIDLKKNYSPMKLVANKMEDLHQALVLGVHDYFYKSGFKKACLGVSGGIDSALVACIATKALGKENVLAVVMPSRYSSLESHSDAQELIKNLGIQSLEIPIEEPFKTYLDLLEPVFQNKAADAAEENIQARIRGMILMAISNKLGYILLSTGNKSELAMGYATLYGDMAGGLAVISDLTKQQVYALSNWINQNEELIPKSTILKPPSAELRPNQKDTDSLPEYDIVDRVLQDYIEEHLSAEEIASKNNYDPTLVRSLIKRIHQNEYKRRQSPPGLRISTKSFSVGRRFPIVQRFVL